MADPTPSTSPANTPPRRSPWGGPVALVLILVLVAGGVLAYAFYTNRAPGPVDELSGIRMMVQYQAQCQKMADRYVDANGDLLADPPAATRNPDVLSFAEIASADPEGDVRRWQPFLDHLAKTTGKKVVLWRPAAPLATEVPVGKHQPDAPILPPSRMAPGTLAQMEAVRNGTLHLSAFGTGAVTAAV